VRRRLEAMDLPQVLSPQALVAAMLVLALSAIVNDDSYLYGAAVGLLIDAAVLRVAAGLRRRW